MPLWSICFFFFLIIIKVDALMRKWLCEKKMPSQRTSKNLCQLFLWSTLPISDGLVSELLFHIGSQVCSSLAFCMFPWVIAILLHLRLFLDENLLGYAIRNRTRYLSDHINFSAVGKVDPYNNIDLPKVSKPQLCCINHPQAKYMCLSAQKDRVLTL